MKQMLSKHFSKEELACRHCGKVGPYPENLKMLLAALENLRALAGKPIHITNAYRCYLHNIDVGGKKLSQHMLARAADLYVDGLSVDEMVALAEQAGFKGIGIYRKQGFIHCDLGPKRGWEG